MRKVQTGLVLHRLIQDVARHRTGEALLPIVVELLREDLPSAVYSAPANWPRWRELLPHVLTAATYHDDAGPVAAEAVAGLLHWPPPTC